MAYEWLPVRYIHHLQVGARVRHRVSGHQYVVVNVPDLDRVQAVRVVDITNPAEWEEYRLPPSLPG